MLRLQGDTQGYRVIQLSAESFLFFFLRTTFEASPGSYPSSAVALLEPRYHVSVFGGFDKWKTRSRLEAGWPLFNLANPPRRRGPG